MRRLSLLIASAPTLLGPTLLFAQSDIRPCTYTECSLRVEGNTLIRGRELVVGHKTLMGMPRMTKLVVPHDSAQAYARSFDHLHPRATWTLFFSAISVGSALGLAADGEWGSEKGPAIGLAATGAVLGIVGWFLDRKATSTLGNALWWHNGSLPRGGEPARP